MLQGVSFLPLLQKKKTFSKITSTSEHLPNTPNEMSTTIARLIFTQFSVVKSWKDNKKKVLQPQKASVVLQTWECPESQTILAVIELLSFIMASLRLSDLKHEGGMCYRGLEGSKRLILFEEETAANHQTPHTAIFSLPFPHSLLHSSPNKELCLLWQ